MPTNNERRDAARKLREIELMRLPDSDSEMEAIHEAVGCWFGQPHFDQEVTDRLADLIDPGDSRSFVTESQSSVTESQKHCDRDALLELATTFEDMAEAGVAVIFDREKILEYARRIREALGVEQ